MTTPKKEDADIPSGQDAAAEAAEAPEPGSHQEKAEQYFDQLLRLQAEFSNYRKRTEKEKTEAIRFGRETMLERLISLADILEQALKHAQGAADVEALKKGFEMVVAEFNRFLKSEGAEAIPTEGCAFDPHQHEAVEQVETEKDEENNIILEEFQKGYRVNGRLLRAAKVKVARKKTKHKNAESADQQQ